ncbi:hypothetical protein Sipo8835_39720 [Streptomyces ipomoeae]|jgi:hypothetical protein|uniref:Uncharacterized protein n=1 Tax=Streptomyces ipomoeae TaxID=103232 RepID=A0AAE8VUM6_9ACTN|nr:hypothetical protein [Streptomyces ipomoeae]MDX2693239.1 hypothetical protein [Streptomyces ipomoeae]MDX2827606.1 hypothetical protein [Streptomyces ipomoeae]MDX2838868.1 hypothetical protein [Streptomyces ipomoeae]MDX2880169.1 hypothetical protein [Streptomyces ipomoeae]TQE19215.1 hypothetical protein Sipo8835_39720 [Streptomyces ipomoeae]
MNELVPAAGLAGALLCVTGHLPGPVHRWGPQVTALGGMALMADGRAATGALAAGIACLWSAVRACVERLGWTGPIDLGVMTLLMVLMTGDVGSGGAHLHTAGAAGVPSDGAVAVLIVVAWVTARAGAFMFRQLSTTSPAVNAVALPSCRRSCAYRESGSVLMIVSMAVMLF